MPSPYTPQDSQVAQFLSGTCREACDTVADIVGFLAQIDDFILYVWNRFFTLPLLQYNAQTDLLEYCTLSASNIFDSVWNALPLGVVGNVVYQDGKLQYRSAAHTLSDVPPEAVAGMLTHDEGGTNFTIKVNGQEVAPWLGCMRYKPDVGYDEYWAGSGWVEKPPQIGELRSFDGQTVSQYNGTGWSPIS